MLQPFKDAIALCKTLMRNGYDAHIINASLQEKLYADQDITSVDIACEPDFVTLNKIFPRIEKATHPSYLAQLTEDGVTFHFFPLQHSGTSHPDCDLLRIAPRLTDGFDFGGRVERYLSRYRIIDEDNKDVYEGFDGDTRGEIRLAGIASEALRQNYLLGIKALRFSANFDSRIEPNSWIAIVRASAEILDYVPVQSIMDEWRKVAPEAMWKFVKLLYDAHILQGLIPEITALACMHQQRNDDGDLETVFEHTINCMKYYPEEGFHYDWLGTFAMLFHDVGKLYTAEYFDDAWTFYQHHRVGAKITRQILRRLHFDVEDVTLICHLVRFHMRFHFMLTDRGIRRFKSLDEYPRLIAMTRADLRARDGSFTYFNHNMKYLERAETPEQMLEPLLNGNEIMQHTNMKPGPVIGEMRDALLKAQIAGEVESSEDAIAFVRAYAQQHVG